MSAVTVPDGKGGFVADFTPQAEAALQRFADAGMHLVKSTDPIASWPDAPRLRRLTLPRTERRHCHESKAATPGSSAHGQLFEAAHTEGVLGPAALQALDVVDLGAQIQAGLGVTVDDVQASEVVLVTMMPDDSGSIRRGQRATPCATATTWCSTRCWPASSRTACSPTPATSTATCSIPTGRSRTRCAMTTANYDPDLGTPLYDQAVVLLGTVIAKAQEFAGNGVSGAHRHAAHHRRRRLPLDPARAQGRRGAGQGHARRGEPHRRGDGHQRRHHRLPRGVPRDGHRGPLDPHAGQSAQEIRRAFQVFSQSAVRASQGAAGFSRTVLGGFGA